MMTENTERIYFTRKATKEQKELPNSSISARYKSSFGSRKELIFGIGLC
jgi:hypothetical protein